MSMYCVYCGQDHDPTAVDFTDEHVIPYAIGGSNALKIRTCARQNNDLGRDVDAPFINLFSVSSKRFFLGLESTKGNPPVLDLSGLTWVNGKEVPISYLIRGDEKELKIARPTVERAITERGEYWQISGDSEQVRQILEGKIRKQSAKGKTVSLADGGILDIEGLDKVLEERLSVTQNPSILRKMEFDPLVPIRFFSKLTLAMGFLHFGELFGKSQIGSLLRAHMQLERLQDSQLKGLIWPMTEPVNQDLEIIGAENEHTLVFLQSDPPVFIANLFGDHGAVIRLSEQQKSNGLTSRMGTSWRIQLPSRRLSRQNFAELMRYRIERKQSPLNPDAEMQISTDEGPKGATQDLDEP